MKFKELEKLLKKNGWYYADAVGSHYQYRHPTKKGKVTVPFHKSDLPIGTVRAILKQAGIMLTEGDHK